MSGLFGEHQIKIADVLCDFAGMLFEQKRFKESRELSQKALKIYESYKTIKEKNAFLIHQISYLREGNSYLLQESMSSKKASNCYKQFKPNLNPPLNPKDIRDQRGLAEEAYLNNKLLPAIEHYQILIRLAPENGSSHHNLACFLHVKAQIAQDASKMSAYLDYLQQTEQHFRRAIELNAHTGVLTEFAHFMHRHPKQYDTEQVIAQLQKAIKLQQLDQVLEYKLLKRPILIKFLQPLLDINGNKLSFNAFYLAH